MATLYRGVLVVLLAGLVACGGDDKGSDTGDGDGDDTSDHDTSCVNDNDGDGVCDSDDICPIGDDHVDGDGDGTPDACDHCPANAGKSLPGLCGCSTADADSDNDGTVDCLEACPGDPLKATQGSCGCGVADTDSDSDGTPDCHDSCPSDPAKILPGVCNCGNVDTDTDTDGTADCNDGCPGDITKIVPGQCGCYLQDFDSDGDHVADCIDGCASDINKSAPGVCGCNISDADGDVDGTPDCHDDCPSDANKTSPGVCGCTHPDVDTDTDGTFDCNDGCPNDIAKLAPGLCGCGVVDSNADTDNDTVPDCRDSGSCGDNVVQLGESCDLGVHNALGAACYPDCQTPYLPYHENFVDDGLVSEHCSPGTVAVGLRYTSNDFDEMTYVQLACRTRTGQTLSGTLFATPWIAEDTFSDNRGSTGMPLPYTVENDGPFLRCDDVVSDAVLVGQRLWEGEDFGGIRALGGVCASLSTGTRFIIGPDTLGTPQITSAADAMEACPHGFAITGLNGSADRIVRRIALECEIEHTDGDVFGDPQGSEIHVDVDSDSDGVINQADVCFSDPLKVTPGTNGCSTPDTDTDNDGVANSIDTGFCGDTIIQFGETCDDGAANVPLGDPLGDGCYSDCTRTSFERTGGGGGAFSDPCGASQVMVGLRYTIASNSVQSPWSVIEPSASKLEIACRTSDGSTLSDPITGSGARGAIGRADILGYPRDYNEATPFAGAYFRCDTLYPDGVVVGLRQWQTYFGAFEAWHVGAVCARLSNGTRYFIGVDQFPTLPRYSTRYESTFDEVPPLSQIPATFQDVCPTGMVASGVIGHAGAVLDGVGLTCKAPL